MATEVRPAKALKPRPEPRKTGQYCSSKILGTTGSQSEHFIHGGLLPPFCFFSEISIGPHRDENVDSQ